MLISWQACPLATIARRSLDFLQISTFLSPSPNSNMSWIKQVLSEHWAGLTVSLFLPSSWVPGLVQQPARPPGPRAAGPAVPGAPHRPHLWRPRLSEAPHEESQPEPGGPSAASTHGHVPHEHRCVLRTPRGLSTRGQGGSCPKRVPCPRGGPFHTRGTSPQRGGLSTVGGLPVGAWPVPEGALSTPGGPLHRGVVCL